MIVLYHRLAAPPAMALAFPVSPRGSPPAMALAFLVALASVVVARGSCDASSFEQDVDLWGHNVDGAPSDVAASAAECCARCSSTTGCLFWSWNQAGDQRCYLKASDTGRGATAGVVSGRSGPAPPPTPPTPPPPRQSGCLWLCAVRVRRASCSWSVRQLLNVRSPLRVQHH